MSSSAYSSAAMSKAASARSIFSSGKRAISAKRSRADGAMALHATRGLPRRTEMAVSLEGFERLEERSRRSRDPAASREEAERPARHRESDVRRARSRLADPHRPAVGGAHGLRG